MLSEHLDVQETPQKRNKKKIDVERWETFKNMAFVPGYDSAAQSWSYKRDFDRALQTAPAQWVNCHM